MKGHIFKHCIHLEPENSTECYAIKSFFSEHLDPYSKYSSGRLTISAEPFNKDDNISQMCQVVIDREHYGDPI
jgi:hypothetical protein